jgi:S-adenosylmethionine decarboxylase
MKYKPGLHILLTISEIKNARLSSAEDWVSFIDEQIKKNNLVSLGYIKHTFDNSGGFTAVHCLTESHISIHTWPEFNLCTADIFLSNYKKDNSAVVRSISQNVINYFGSDVFQINEVSR